MQQTHAKTRFGNSALLQKNSYLTKALKSPFFSDQTKMIEMEGVKEQVSTTATTVDQVVNFSSNVKSVSVSPVKVVKFALVYISHIHFG